MGALISGEQFLLELASREGSGQAAGRKLLRMQILTSQRTGHLLVLGYEYPRRMILRAARCGKVADLWVACQRCYCMARLAEWERSSRMPGSARRELAEALREGGLTAEVLYLRPCPGDEYAQDVLEGLALMGVR